VKAGKSKIKGGGVVSGEIFLPGSLMTTFLLYLHFVVSVSSRKGTNLLTGAPPKSPHSKFNYFLKAPSPNTITVGVNTSVYKLLGIQFSP
jgi:hypothetical protein